MKATGWKLELLAGRESRRWPTGRSWEQRRAGSGNRRGRNVVLKNLPRVARTSIR